MKIRLLQEHDFTQWLPLWHDYVAFYQADVSDEVTRHTWRNLVSHDKMHAFGAFDDSGSLKAFAHIVQHPNTWNISECVYLEDLFVAPDARRQGFARALIEAVYAFAKRQQCHRVYWVTAKDNANTQALYRQLAQETGMVQFQHDIKNLYSQS